MAFEVSQQPGFSSTETNGDKSFSAESRRRLRVVIVDEELPYPPVTGKRIRILNLIRHLATRHDLTFICHANTNKEEIPEARSHLESLGVETIVVPLRGIAKLATAGRFLQPVRIGLNLFTRRPYSVQWHQCANIQRAIIEHAKKQPVDLWQCEWAPYAINLLKAQVSPWIMMAHDIQSSIWQRHHQAEPNWAKRAYILRQWRRYQKYEGTIFASADRTIAVTEENARISREVFGARRTAVVENGVDVSHYQECNSSARDPRKILFLGNLQWRPNLDAVRQLLDDIFPRVRAQEPSARLVIVGRCPPRWLCQKSKTSSNVQLYADVADVRPFLHESGIMAVPLRFASGSRLKILEALATGLPVVSSRVGAEGLRLEPGKHYARADTSEEMAAAIVHWIRNPEIAEASAHAGRTVVEEKYDWGMLAEHMDAAWQSLTERP